MIEQFDFVDASAQFCAGASFGGWATIFMNGAAPCRFRALVAHDGSFDGLSMYYTTDELFFMEIDWGNPLTDGERYRLMSPSSSIERWQTPILLMHGEKDYRVPISESLAVFTAARRRGLKARLCVSEEANHGCWACKRPCSGTITSASGWPSSSTLPTGSENGLEIVQCFSSASSNLASAGSATSCTWL